MFTVARRKRKNVKFSLNGNLEMHAQTPKLPPNNLANIYGQA